VLINTAPYVQSYCKLMNYWPLIL